MYKQATQLKLRFTTNVGQLSTEQLWDLNLNQLSSAIKSVKKQLKQNTDDDLSFLDDVNVVADDINQIRFNILKDVYITKKNQANEERIALENKKHNEKIDLLIAEKIDDDMKKLTVEQLKELRK